jgi:putative phage-type endonuclease
MNDTVQRSPEWYFARLGRVTASRAADVLATIKSGEAATRKNYRSQLVCERLTAEPEESFETDAMRWGTEQEPFARMAFEASKGLLVQEVGFIQHPELMAGASPDGLIDDDLLVEIKCPGKSAHIDTLEKGMPSKHIPQVQFQMWITGRKACWFVSYHPKFPQELQLFTQLIPRDDAYIANLEAEVRKFLGEVDALCDRLFDRQLAEAA